MKKAIPNEGNSIGTGLAVWRKHRALANNSKCSNGLVFMESRKREARQERYVEANLGSRRSYTKAALILFHWLWKVTETF